MKNITHITMSFTSFAFAISYNNWSLFKIKELRNSKSNMLYFFLFFRPVTVSQYQTPVCAWCWLTSYSGQYISLWPRKPEFDSQCEHILFKILMLLLKFKYPNLISTDDCSSDNLSIYQMVVIVLLGIVTDTLL